MLKNIKVLRALYNLYDMLVAYLCYSQNYGEILDRSRAYDGYKDGLAEIMKKYNISKRKLLKLNDKAIRLWHENNTI